MSVQELVLFLPVGLTVFISLLLLVMFACKQTFIFMISTAFIRLQRQE